MIDNVILIGMPGVGKSTAGVILAKVLGYQFVDSDLLIQQQEQCLLKDIIEEKGVDGFIEVENKVNANLQVHRSVVATGGSVVYGKEAMAHLKEIGTVVYLRVPFEVLNERLSDIKGRGVTLRKGQTLLDLFYERKPLYEKYADYIVDETAVSTIEDTVASICTYLNK